MNIKEALRIYFIMGSNNCGSHEPLDVLQQAIDGGITMFQFREKGNGALTGEAKKQFARDCFRLCKQANVPFIVNDDVDLAIEIGADGVHVGQDDLDAGVVRQKLGADKIIGVSSHTLQESKAAIEAGADYIGMGPVYATTTKLDTNPVAGTKAIQETRQHFAQFPIVAIGGLQADNFAPAIEAGADGISIISAIASAPNPKEATEKLASTMKEVINDAK